MRSWAAGILLALLLVCGAVAVGLRFNGTHSFPVGFYLTVHKRPEKGDLVTVNLTLIPIFALAQDRGYLNVAYSPVTRIMKRIVGVPGDLVAIDSSGVTVNGIRLVNSAPLRCDGGGRPMPAYALSHHVLGPGQVLLMSDYNPASFDSRYFGPLQATMIESVVTPLLTWN